MSRIARIHLPQYEEIYEKVRNRIGRLIGSRRRSPQGYRKLALDILDTAHNIIISKLGSYREFYEILKNEPFLTNYVKEVYGETTLNYIKRTAYLDSHVTRLWRTLRKHIQYMPLDGIVNEALNYTARLLSVVKRNKRMLEKVLEVKKEVARTPIAKKGIIPIIIAGPPNAGKSTLLNTIAGTEFSVAPHPFTTKKAIAARRGNGALEYLLIDTPGILRSEGHNIAERRALAYIKYPYSIVLVLLDPSPDSVLSFKEQADLLRYLASLNPNIIIAINKVDAYPLESRSIEEFLRKEGYTDVLLISAKTGEGLDRLINVLSKMLKETLKATGKPG